MAARSLRAILRAIARVENLPARSGLWAAKLVPSSVCQISPGETARFSTGIDTRQDWFAILRFADTLVRQATVRERPRDRFDHEERLRRQPLAQARPTVSPRQRIDAKSLLRS